MWTDIGSIIVFLFGLFFIIISGIMFFKPNTARATLRKAGSTHLINYAEITIRIIPAIGLIVAATASKTPLLFKTFGWFMLLTSLVLYFVPRQLHHTFSLKSADILKPLYIQILSPVSLIIGVLLIYSIY